MLRARDAYTDLATRGEVAEAYRFVEAPAMRHKARMVPLRIGGSLQAPAELASMEAAP